MKWVERLQALGDKFTGFESTLRSVGNSTGLILSCILVFSVAVLGQGTASIEGIVKDEGGNVIPGANVTAKNTDTSLVRSVTTSSAGYYRISSLPVGGYDITVEAQGFARALLQATKIQVDQLARLDFTLKVGSVQETVTINQEVPLVDTSTAAGGGVIENRRMVELPLNGRNFLQLALLVPGTTASPQGTTQSTWGSVGGGIGFSVSGNRDSYNVFTLDGVNVMDRHYNTLTVSPSVEAIQEFKIIANGYSARYGLLPGAQVDVVTKSGANSVRGSIYEFIRNDKLDAKNFFDDPNREIPPFRQNQFGVTLGGPIIKNKTFFFGNYEGLRVRQGLTIRTIVPTDAMRRGDLSGINPGTGLPFPIIRDPLTGQPFLGNIIPSNQIHPLAAGVLNLVPPTNVPNAAPGQFNRIAVQNRVVDNDQFTIRIDHQVTQNNLLFGRYTFQRNDELEPFVRRFTPGLPPPEGFGDVRDERGRNLGIGLTSALTPNLINEFRFSYNRLNASRVSENSNSNFLESVRIPRFGETLNKGVPFIVIPGLGQMGDSDNLQPNIRNNDIFQFKDDMTVNKGLFTHEWGADYRRVRTNGVTDTFSQGEFRFGDERLGFGQTLTGSGFSDFLLDRPRVSLIQLGTGVGSYRYNYFGTYFNTNWRATPRFTLNLGVRYEFETAPTPISGQYISILDTSRGAIIIGSQSGSLPPLNDPLTQYFINTFGTRFISNRDAGLPASINSTDFANIAPRLGFSWNALGNAKLVLRGSFGIYTNLQERPYETSSNRLGPPFAPTIVSFQNLLFFPGFTPLTYENVFARGGPADRPPSDGGPSTGGVPPKVNIGYLEQWNFGIQSQITNNLVAEVVYVGSRGINVNGFIIANQNFPNTPERAGGFSPDPRFGESFQEHSGGDSWYHGLTLRLQRRFSRGLTFTTGYTFSKSEDTVSTFTGGPTDSPVPQNSYDIGANKALSNFDRRHSFTLSYLYELPFGEGKSFFNKPGVASAILGNWQLGGILTLQSGTPFTVQLTGNVSGIASSGADRPDCIADPNLTGERTPDRWFDTTAFSLPRRIIPAVGFPYRILGNCGRNIVTGPPFRNFDLTLSKNIPVGEQRQITLRAEFFNLTNHPNFNIPDRFFGSATFGKITSARFPRQIQFGVRFAF